MSSYFYESEITMGTDIIFTTGYFGSQIEDNSKSLADSKGYLLLSLDELIEKSDGRSIRRICMMMGEHEYRNKEYSAIKDFLENPPDDNVIVFCSDGVLLDDMSRELILKHNLIIFGLDKSADELWNHAKNQNNSYHAFMHFGSEEDRHSKFLALIDRQKNFFDIVLDTINKL